MTMWHNISALAKRKPKVQLLDRAEIERVLRESTDEIIRRITQNPEPVNGDIRVRVMLEKVD